MWVKCLKCKKEFTFADADQIDDRCSVCQSKNLEIKEEEEGIEIHILTNECSKCRLTKVIDILNWEDIKESTGASKEKIIEEMSKSGGKDKFCSCSIRERAKMTTSLLIENILG